MPPSTTKTEWRASALRSLVPRFRREESGTSAIEFALLIVPFLIFLFLLVEVALVFLVGQALENATQNEARMIRTGRTANFTKESFERDVCSRLRMFPNCAEALKLDVRVVPDFETAANLEAPAADGDFVFDKGRGNDIVIVRAYYDWSGTRVLPRLINAFYRLYYDNSAQQSSTVYRLTAATLFRNEPF